MRKCLSCQKEFESRRKDHVFCSKTCRNRISNLRTHSREFSTWGRRGIDITIEQRDNLLCQQQNKCRICNKSIQELGKSLNIDHDHKTGKVRGMLCSQCNCGIGLFKDNPALLRSAANYLESHLV